MPLPIHMVDCPSCGAEAGHPCVRLPEHSWHPARLVAAKRCDMLAKLNEALAAAEQYVSVLVAVAKSK